MTYVYVFSTNGQSPVKIGVTHNIQKRIRAIQTGNANVIRCEYQIEVSNAGDARALERSIHTAMGDRRLSGEWFDASPDDVVDKVKQLSGLAITKHNGSSTSERIKAINAEDDRIWYGLRDSLICVAHVLSKTIEVVEELSIIQDIYGNIPNETFSFDLRLILDEWKADVDPFFDTAFDASEYDGRDSALLMIHDVMDSEMDLWFGLDHIDRKGWILRAFDQNDDGDDDYPDQSLIKQCIDRGKAKLARLQDDLATWFMVQVSMEHRREESV